MTDSKFEKNSSIVLEYLEKALANIRTKQLRVRERLEALRIERKDWMDGFIAEKLPDVSSVTLIDLYDTLPAFMTQGVQRLIERHRQLKPPFLLWLFGGGDRYQNDADTDLLEQLRTYMRGYVDTMVSDPVLDLLDTQIVMAEFSERSCAFTEIELRQQISALTFARASPHPVPPKYAKAVASSAVRATHSSRADARALDSTDDLTLLTLFMIQQDTFEATFTISPSGDVDYRPDVFTAGGGSFGGAGASGEWGNPQPSGDQQSSNVAPTESPQPTVFDDASVAGLGSIS